MTTVSSDYEQILDLNNRPLLAGDKILVVSLKEELPFYKVVYRNPQKKLCIELDGQEESVSDLIANNFDLELVIPVFHYEFKPKNDSKTPFK